MTAILIDLFNTLVAGGDRRRIEVTAVIAADLGVDPVRYQRLFSELWRDRLAGHLGDLPTTLLAVARRLGAEPSAEAVASAAGRRVALTRELLRPDQPTLDTLDSLRAAGHRLGVVSNCTEETAAIWPETMLARRFGAVAFSCALGVGKPDRRNYLLACDALGALPGSACYVGDGADGELSGAVSAGLRAIQTTQYAQTDRTWAGERINMLADLVPLMLSGRPG